MRRELLLVSALLACACGRTSSAPLDAGQSATAPSATPTIVAALPSPLPEAGPLRGPLQLACRAIEVKGSPSILADAGIRPLATSDVAAGWIKLGAADSITAKLPRSGREVTMLGPGFVQPCAAPDEAWVARGRFQGSRGSGEAPGAEEWVVTPFAVVRYAAALVEVTVETSQVRVSLKGGSAAVLAEGASAWEQVDAAAGKVVKGTGGTATAAAERCSAASGAAKGLEDALVAPGATRLPTFGDLAVRAGDARLLARASCAIANLRAVPEPR